MDYNLIHAYLIVFSGFTNIQEITRADIKGNEVLVNINHGDFERTENYSIDLLALMEFMWNNRSYSISKPK